MLSGVSISSLNPPSYTISPLDDSNEKSPAKRKAFTACFLAIY
jgi:hypothetical protein